MRKFIIERSRTETYTATAGLSLVGLILNRFTDLVKCITGATPQEKGIPHKDIVLSYAGLLATGKSDFDAIENQRDKSFFKDSLDIEQVPSSATLRQQLDEHADAFAKAIKPCVTEVIQRGGGAITPLDTGHVPLDIDVFPMDNSGTKKEHIGRTYKGHDGYAPIAAYLGMEGWMLDVELRPGTQHSQKDFIPFLKGVIARSRVLTNKRLLARLDSAHDAIETFVTLREERNVAWIVKWNPRSETAAAEWFDEAFATGTVTTPRAGKRVALFTKRIARSYNGRIYFFTRVMRVIERTIDKHGQVLVAPELEIEGWWTSLELPAEKIIKLYENHGLSEQFHSEIKTDLDLERLPSGKFATNSLVMSIGSLVYNVLRLIGQQGLLDADAPIRHTAKRRRIKTVLQEIIYIAARVIASGRRLRLRFSWDCSAFNVFKKLYCRFSAA